MARTLTSRMFRVVEQVAVARDASLGKQSAKRTGFERMRPSGINNIRRLPPDGFVVADDRIMATWNRDLCLGVRLGLALG